MWQEFRLRPKAYGWLDFSEVDFHMHGMFWPGQQMERLVVTARLGFMHR